MTTFLIAMTTSKIEEKTKFGGFQLSPHIMTLLYMGHIIVRRFWSNFICWRVIWLEKNLILTFCSFLIEWEFLCQNWHHQWNPHVKTPIDTFSALKYDVFKVLMGSMQLDLIWHFNGVEKKNKKYHKPDGDMWVSHETYPFYSHFNVAPQ